MSAAGALPANLIGFARLLRRAGLPVGPAETLAAGEALSLAGLTDRATVHAALRATLVHRREHFEVFDHAFDLWWRDPEASQHARAMALLDGFKEKTKAPPAARRVQEALHEQKPAREPKPDEQKQELDVAMTVSEQERLRRMDFEAMGAAEIAEAKRQIARLVLPLDDRPTRRFRPDPRGPRVDLRRTIRASLRSGGEVLALARTRRRVKPPPLVALCDISGSMTRYAQILLHFLHALANRRARVSVFLFGTRLTNVTRALLKRDPEVAFEMVARILPDWSGGTRIGESLSAFNRLWARRVLAQGAVVLLITDGLDRQGAEGLAEAADRLQRSCRRLVWLNPLLRFQGFQPKSQGARALLPHVHEHRPVHNLASLKALVDSLSGQPAPHRRAA